MSNLILSVVANSFWIVGLAILLAAFSYHYDQAQRHQLSLRQQLKSHSFVVAAWVSATLVTVGLVGTSSRTWEAAIWLIFALYSLINTVKSWREYRHNAENTEPHGN